MFFLVGGRGTTLYGPSLKAVLALWGCCEYFIYLNVYNIRIIYVFNFNLCTENFLTEFIPIVYDLIIIPVSRFT